MENKVLSSLLNDRDSYNLVKDILRQEDFSDIGWVIVEGAFHYYGLDSNAKYVDKEVLLNRLARDKPAIQEMAERVLDNLEDTSAPNIINEYVEQRLASLSLRIGHCLANNQSNDVDDLMREWATLKEHRDMALFSNEEDKVTEGLSVTELLDLNNEDVLVPIYPDKVNDAIGGGAPPGSHIVVFARPEVGKSMFCINMVAGFIKHGHTALYIGNEDPAKSMKRRIASNILQMPTPDLKLEDPLYIEEQLEEAALGKLVFASLHPGTTGDVRRLVEKHRPEVVVVDQIRNLRTPKSFTKVEGLEFVAQEMRNIAKEFDCVMVSVTQAGDSASNKLELDMGDIDFSNTGIPATADLMLGIGMTPEYDMLKKRMISMPKNKLSGEHGSFVVSVNPGLSEVY